MNHVILSMNFILLIFVCGVLASDTTDLTPSEEESDFMPESSETQDKEDVQAEEETALGETDQVPAVEQGPEDQATLSGDQPSAEETATVEDVATMQPEAAKQPSQKQNQAPDQDQDEKLEHEQNLEQEEKQEQAPKPEAKDKNHQGFRDTKQYSFTTQNANGSESEITLKATTDLQFTVKNYNSINKTQPKEKPTEENIQQRLEKKIPKPTQVPNEAEFWTMLAKAIHATYGSSDDKELLYQPIPESDLGDESEENPEDLENIKLKLMLGISLLTLLLFVLSLAICVALLYKMKVAESKKECVSDYAINPELASVSYFHPSEGISDTSFSKSESSTYWGTTSSEMKKSEIIEIKTQTKDVISTGSEDTGLIDESDIPQSEEPSEELSSIK